MSEEAGEEQEAPAEGKSEEEALDEAKDAGAVLPQEGASSRATECDCPYQIPDAQLGYEHDVFYHTVCGKPVPKHKIQNPRHH